MTYRRVIMLLVDGVSTDTLKPLLDSGALPALAQFAKQGSFYPDVVASFPTVTGPAHVPLFSGVHPSSLDIIGHNQYIRHKDRFENYLLNYSHLTRAFGDGPTLYKDFLDSVSVNEPFRAGAHAYRRNPFALADWARIRGLANWYALRRVQHEYRHQRDFIAAWLHETDGLAHMSPRVSHVSDALKQLDRWLERFTKEIGDDTLLIVCSDHGMERTNARPVQLSRELRQAGFRFRDFKLYLDGGAFAQIYLKRNGSFRRKLDEQHLGDLPERFALMSSTDLVLYRRGDGYVVRSRRGIATCGPDLTYQVSAGQDPLDRQTNSYPDALRQIKLLLRAPSSGDIVLTGGPRVTFNALTRYAVHGGLRREQAVTFLLSNRSLDGPHPSQTLSTADVPALVRANTSPRSISATG